MISAIFVSICAAVVLAVCVALVFYREYEDGFFGRIGLALMGLGALGRILSTFDALLPVSNIGVLVWSGMALFLSRHFYRFLRWHHKKDYAWRKADAQDAPGKNVSN